MTTTHDSLEQKMSDENLKRIFELFRSLQPEKQTKRTPVQDALAKLESYNPYFSHHEYMTQVHND
jgi:hypothetical protein